MAKDPFPNTSDGTTELRFSALFSSTSSILTVPTDPMELKDGLMWLNTTELRVKIFSGGRKWTIGLLSVAD